MIRTLKYMFLAAILSTTACDMLDQQIDMNHTEETFYKSGYLSIRDYGMQSYGFLRGFTDYDGNSMLAASCDEADFARPSQMQYFNLGAWGAFNNPDNVFTHYYKGIRHINLFLDKTGNFRDLLVKDTVSNKNEYLMQCDDVFRLRAEAHFLRAFYYMELIKRYGGVPIVDSVLPVNNVGLPRRNTFDECVEFIVNDCDSAYKYMADSWRNYGVPPGGGVGDGKGDAPGSTDVTRLGRAEKVAAKALKMRALLYAASPLNNPGDDVNKWKRAAAAGNDFFTDPQLLAWYNLNFSYWELFSTQADLKYLTSQKGRNTGIIFTVPFEGNGNAMERFNYPSGAPNGGQAVTAPSQNLVDAYECSTGESFDWNNATHAANPYKGRDPRMKQTIACDADVYGKNTDGTDRPVQTFDGGVDAVGSNKGATTTGYYLKKFTIRNYNLSLATSTKAKAWVLMRVGEMYLNVAEAMNEAYGPDAKVMGDGGVAAYSAREAVNKVRTRSDVMLPELPTGLTQAQMQKRIRQERRVELAFEEHRPFDVRRWMLPMAEVAAPIEGVRIVKNSEVTTYSKFIVEQRSFTEKMYRYPIPFEEIQKSGGVIEQNPGW